MSGALFWQYKVGRYLFVLGPLPQPEKLLEFLIISYVCLDTVSLSRAIRLQERIRVSVRSCMCVSVSGCVRTFLVGVQPFPFPYNGSQSLTIVLLNDCLCVRVCLCVYLLYVFFYCRRFYGCYCNMFHVSFFSCCIIFLEFLPLLSFLALFEMIVYFRISFVRIRCKFHNLTFLLSFQKQ